MGAPKKPCAQPGCPERVPLRVPRCATHQRTPQRSLDARRGSSTGRGYGYDWQRVQAAWLRAHPLCGDREHGPSAQHSRCVGEGRTTAGALVDHIVPIRVDPARRLDASNLQTLCTPCHATKSAEDARRYGPGG